MARAGRVLAATLDALAERVRPGVSTAELDKLAERFIRARGATPTFKGYRGFPGSICASPNEMIVHGIPGPYRLKKGDIISIDVGVTPIFLFFLWHHRIAPGIIVGFVPPILVSAAMMMWPPNLEKMKNSPLGNYISKYMTSTIEAIRLLSLAPMAWEHGSTPLG